MSDREKNRAPLGSRIWERVRRLLWKNPTPPPADPYAYRMAPVRRGPKGRSGATVAEPEDDSYQAYPPRRA
ncbi:MAG TPA: hypothetical protein VIH89_19285 [Candidatus Sulfotelmatobacter sp.]